MSKIIIKLNSQEKIEAILQELYDDTVHQMNLAQNKINELTESTDLVNELIDGKAKYMKAIHDFIVDKHNAIKTKIEISKLLLEVYKNKGNIEETLNSDNQSLSSILSEVKNKLDKDIVDSDDSKKMYNIDKVVKR